MTICKQYRNKNGDIAHIHHDPHFPGGYELLMFDKYGQRIWKGIYTDEKGAVRAMRKQCKGMQEEEDNMETMENATVESVFTGKSGCTITVMRFGVDDYSVAWDEAYSVRGTLKQILDEMKDEI